MRDRYQRTGSSRPPIGSRSGGTGSAATGGSARPAVTESRAVPSAGHRPAADRQQSAADRGSLQPQRGSSRPASQPVRTAAEPRPAAPERTLAGTGTIVGRVVRCQPRPRRGDFLHAYFGSLINGAAFSFSPVGQVITVDVSSGDYLTIDRNQRRTVVVNLVGRIYDGAILEQDWVEVTGNWSANGTLNATRVYNTTNNTRVELSHAVPAVVVRLMTALVAGVLLWELAAGSFRLPSLTGGLAAALGSTLEAVAVIAVLLVLVRLFFRHPPRALRRLLGRLILLLVLALLCYYLIVYAPAALEALLILGATLWAIGLMISGVFK